MGASKNDRATKRAFQFAPAHNRKAGMGKFWKQLTNRKRRRQGSKFNRQMVEEREHD